MASANMSPESRIAVVGCGKMGEAILKGWIASDVEPASQLGPESFIVVEPSDERREQVTAEHGVRAVGNVMALDAFDAILLAVKPQVMAAVLDELAKHPQFCAAENPVLVITIAAGVTTDQVQDAFGESCHVVRVMPNMPLQIGMGATVVAGGSSATAEEEGLVQGLFDALGYAAVVPEDQIDAVCAISGGGPAYVAHMVEALRDAGVQQGLSADLAEKLALQTLGGSFHIMEDEGVSPEDLRVSVCSPGGTTLAALAAMQDAGFEQSIANGIDAAVRRADELRRMS